MAVASCSNPFKIPGHHRRSTSHTDTIAVDASYYEKYFRVCSNLSVGSFLCSKCTKQIASVAVAVPNCVDPFSKGVHSSDNYKVITLDTQRAFFSFRNKLPIGSSLCRKCLVRLSDQQTLVKPSFSEIPNLCCNPFGKADHSTGKNERHVLPGDMVLSASNAAPIFVGDVLCLTCRVTLTKIIKRELCAQSGGFPSTPEMREETEADDNEMDQEDNDSLEENSPEKLSPGETYEKSIALDKINICLNALNLKSITQVRRTNLVDTFRIAVGK